MRKIHQLVALASLALGVHGLHAQTTPTFQLASNLPAAPIAVDAGADLMPQEIYTPQALNASANGGAGTLMYSWAPTTGLDDASSPTPTLTYDLGVDSYVLTVTDELGCIAMDTLQIDFSVSRVPFSAHQFRLDVIPNPSHGAVTLLMTGEPVAGELSLEVMDALGRVVYQEQGLKFSGRMEKPLSLEGLEQGVYFLVVADQTRQAVKKLILQ